MRIRSTKMTRTLGLAISSLLLIGAGCKTDNAAQVTANANTAPAPEAATKYKDGTYTAVGDYTYHSGSERITLGLTLKNDVIVDTTYEAKANVPPSEKFMKLFGDNYKALVVGKNIDEVTLDKVSGSSRTPIGFNDAVAKIKAQAAVK